MPIASIVVPSYNHAAYLATTLDSALGQSLADLEVVVVDDGSTDGSGEVLERFSRDPRVRIELQENRGADVAIARGLSLAQGEIVFVLNSDDLFPPTRVERLVRELEENPGAAAVCSWVEIVDAAGAHLGVKQAWRTLPPWPQPVAGAGLQDTGDPALALLRENFVATTSNLALRRLHVPALRLAPLRYCHDWDLVLQLTALGELRVVPEPLVLYRVHPANTLREGQHADSGQGRMRFEILWVIARHAHRVLAEARRRGWSETELAARFWRSAPQFERPEILGALLGLAGTQEGAALESLLSDGHPLRRTAVAALAGG